MNSVYTPCPRYCGGEVSWATAEPVGAPIDWWFTAPSGHEYRDVQGVRWVVCFHRGQESAWLPARRTSLASW